MLDLHIVFVFSNNGDAFLHADRVTIIQ